MDELSKVRNHIQSLHLKAICGEFRLQPGNDIKTLDMNGAYPDLANSGRDIDSIFELKSRNHALKKTAPRNRYRSDACWWSLIPEQIERYEHIRDLNPEVDLYWMFLISETDRPPTLLSQLREGSIVSRDIYVLPWDAYRLVEPSPQEKFNLGLARLTDTYRFSEISAKKGRVCIEKGIEEKVGKYFR